MNQIQFNKSEICYFLISQKGPLKIQTPKECYTLIIEDLQNVEIQNIESNKTINNIYFKSNTLMLPFDVEKINEIIKIFQESIKEIKISGYLINNYKSLSNFFFPQYLDKLSINNLIYPNFNIFQSIQQCNINTFKLSNYKFTSNSHLKDFFEFIMRVKVQNLILKNIFIEILEINDFSIEYGIINSYFVYYGNKIMICQDNKNIESEIKSLSLSNCRLIFINFEKFSTVNEQKYISIKNNSLLFQNDNYAPFIEFIQNNHEFSIIIDCQYQINEDIFNFICHYSFSKIKFINCNNTNVFFKGKEFHFKNIKFKYCSHDFVFQILKNNKNNIQNLSIKDTIDKKPKDNQNLKLEENSNLNLGDTLIEILIKKLNELKLGYYNYEIKDFEDKNNYLNSLITSECNKLILKGNIFNLIKINKNIKFNSEKIVLKNIISDKSIENYIKSSNIKDKEIYFINCYFFFYGKKTTYLDYNTFNNFIFVNNEFNDLSHFINCSIFDEETKFNEKYNIINEIIKPFFENNNNICFQINNQNEFRNIVLTLTLFYKNKGNKITDELKENFIINEENIKLLSKYYFTNEQIEKMNNLNINFIFQKKNNNF